MIFDTLLAILSHSVNKFQQSQMEMFEPSLICRLCLVNLEEFKECYLINEEIEKLINSSTGISV